MPASSSTALDRQRHRLVLHEKPPYRGAQGLGVIDDENAGRTLCWRVFVGSFAGTGLRRAIRARLPCAGDAPTLIVTPASLGVSIAAVWFAFCGANARSEH